MPLTEKQRRALKAKLSHRHVKSRINQGTTISYVEGWHAVAEANRIFGYDSWDRQTQSPQCIWSDRQRGQFECFYSTKVRITVRAGDTITIREGIGTGFGRSPSTEMAHEIALKAAETDATKRALATFGNPFGLALYDKKLSHVTRPKSELLELKETKALRSVQRSALRLELRLVDEARVYGDVEEFAAAAVQATTKLDTVDAVYAFWDANLSNFALAREITSGGNDPVVSIISALKGRARSFIQLDQTKPVHQPQTTSVAEIASPLAIPKERRIRNKGHLSFVASQPCLVCGRKPTHAHHIRFAQPTAMSMKVSDEFTVPLCSSHHDALHRSGDERTWWQQQRIADPLKFAARLWAASSGRLDDNSSVDGREVEVAPLEPPALIGPPSP